jgi:hypothetical protein
MAGLRRAAGGGVRDRVAEIIVCDGVLAFENANPQPRLRGLEPHE